MTSIRPILVRLALAGLTAVLLPACALSPNTGVGCAARTGSGGTAAGCGGGMGF
ncbi:hypothetical protein ACDA63_01765 [Uliginosibacterium sp. sgz301328]|uniref:hypothetical protein n=1 Tax=Uliginosibacterium sp. sgz301328 TaxID=3243764 RepID=UPI00359D7401